MVTTFEWNRRYFGLWNEAGYADQPCLAASIDTENTEEDINKIVSFLRNSAVVEVIPTKEYCLICDQHIGEFGMQSDGEWIWCRSLWHYVEEHKVSLPEKLVQHIRRNNYQCTVSSIDLAKLDWPYGRPGSRK